MAVNEEAPSRQHGSCEATLAACIKLSKSVSFLQEINTNRVFFPTSPFLSATARFLFSANKSKKQVSGAQNRKVEKKNVECDYVPNTLNNVF